MSDTLRFCLSCGTKYEPIAELHEGGPCPTCDSRIWEPAVSIDYRIPKPTTAPLQRTVFMYGSTLLGGSYAERDPKGPKPSHIPAIAAKGVVQ